MPSPLHSIRTPGEWELVGNGFNKRSSNVSYYQQEESTSYRNEPRMCLTRIKAGNFDGYCNLEFNAINESIAHVA